MAAFHGPVYQVIAEGVKFIGTKFTIFSFFDICKIISDVISLIADIDKLSSLFIDYSV